MLKFGLLLGCIATFTAPASAAWAPNGIPVSSVPGSRPALVSDGVGGLFIAWVGDDVRVQRITSEGDVALAWPADGTVIAPPTVYWHEKVGGATDSSGGVWISWSTIDDIGATWLLKSAHVQHVNSFGGAFAPPGGLNVGGPNTANNPLALAPDGSGGVITLGSGFNFSCTEGFCAPPDPHTWVKRLNAHGELAWTFMLSADERRHGFVAKDPSSATILVGSGGVVNVHATLLNLDGTLAPGWTAPGVPVVLASEGPGNFSCAADGNGGMSITWNDYRNGSAGFGWDVFAQHVLSSGEVAAGWPIEGAEVVANVVNDQLGPRIAPDGSGGAYVAWQDLRSGEWRVYTQHLTASGTPASGWPATGRPVAATPGGQDGHAIASDGLGGAIVAWLDRRNGTEQVYALGLLADGSTAPGWPDEGTPVTTTLTSKSGVEVVGVAPGEAVVVWPEQRGPGVTLFAQRAAPDVVTAALISVVHARAIGDDAELRWYAPQLAGASARIERSLDGVSWQLSAEVSVDDNGYLSFLDEALAPGRYGYRAIGRDGDREFVSPESWVEIVPSAAFGILGVRPNPTRGAFEVALRLDGAPARVEIVDVAGRVVDAHDVDGSTSVVRLAPMIGTRPLASGVYAIRLVGDRRFASRRVVLVP